MLCRYGKMLDVIVGVSALDKKIQTDSSSIRLGNEQMKWADTPKIRASSAVVLMRGDF